MKSENEIDLEFIKSLDPKRIEEAINHLKDMGIVRVLRHHSRLVPIRNQSIEPHDLVQQAAHSAGANWILDELEKFTNVFLANQSAPVLKPTFKQPR